MPLAMRLVDSERHQTRRRWSVPLTPSATAVAWPPSPHKRRGEFSNWRKLEVCGQQVNLAVADMGDSVSR